VRAAYSRAYGPPESVGIEDIDPPPVGPGEARVKVRAAAVNFPDVLVVANEYQVKVPLPFVPGSEFAGEILELGAGTAGLRPGDRVFGTTMVGAFAEEVVVGVQSLSPVPDGVDERAAAAFGVAHRTAYHSLRSVAQLQAGDELIVLGAGGGVGLAAVQVGVALGARVTAVASTADKLKAAAQEGAAEGVNYRSADLRQALRALLPEGADVVLDPVGGQLSEPALRSLRWGGRFVTVGYASGEIPRVPLNLVLLKGVRVLGFEFRGFSAHAQDDMRRNEQELMALLKDGRVTPHIGASFELDEAAAALRYVADGRAIGKVVLDIPR
jgi:NADPH2:quinone reductase